MAKNKEKELTYETALAELQDIVTRLQEEVVGIDDLSVKARRAAELVRYCQEKLRTTKEDLKGLFDNEK